MLSRASNEQSSSSKSWSGEHLGKARFNNNYNNNNNYNISIQDHYTNAQPGIQRTVFKLKELVR